MWVGISQSGPLATGNFKWCYFDRHFVPWYAISIWISLCCSVISLVSCFIQLQFTKFHSMNCLKKYFFYSSDFCFFKVGFCLLYCKLKKKNLGFLDSCAKSFLSFAQFSNLIYLFRYSACDFLIPSFSIRNHFTFSYKLSMVRGLSVLSSMHIFCNLRAWQKGWGKKNLSWHNELIRSLVYNPQFCFSEMC